MNKTGYLIIHGFAGNLNEISHLDRYLREKGYVTLCPVLKGHTGRRRNLAWVSDAEWIRSAEDAFLQLSAKCEKMVLIGFSMGGLISVNLASKYQVSAIVTLGMPIYPWDMKRIGLNIINDMQTGRFKHLKYYTRAFISIPFSAFYHFRKMLQATKPMLKQIQAPIWIGQGLLDDTVHHRSAEYIYNNVASEIKSIHYYKNSDHQICSGADREMIFHDIETFIRQNCR